MNMRIPISVEVIYEENGKIVPKKLHYRNRTFEIARFIGTRRCCPEGISCVSPFEFVVVIDNQKRKLYFEPSTNKWFSVKKYETRVPY